MIQFKCIYCGHGLTAQEDERGQKDKCPKCNHDYFVPKKIKISVEKIDRYAPKIARCQYVLERYNKSEFYKENFKWLIPNYDALSLFLMAFTLIMLFVGNAPMRETIYILATGLYKCLLSSSRRDGDHNLFIWVFLVAVIFFLYGFGLSIYHLYTTKKKTRFEKQTMLVFAVVTNISTALAAGIYMLRESSSWTFIFPVWNLINAYLLVALVQKKMINETCISDRKATFRQMIGSMTAIFIIFVFCNFILKLYWAITFSICIVYTASFDKTLQNVFPGLSAREDKQTS